MLHSLLQCKVKSNSSISAASSQSFCSEARDLSRPKGELRAKKEIKRKLNTSDTSIYLQVLSDFLIDSAACCLLASSPDCSEFDRESLLAQRELAG